MATWISSWNVSRLLVYAIYRRCRKKGSVKFMHLLCILHTYTCCLVNNVIFTELSRTRDREWNIDLQDHATTMSKMKTNFFHFALLLRVYHQSWWRFLVSTSCQSCCCCCQAFPVVALFSLSRGPVPAVSFIAIRQRRAAINFKSRWWAHSESVKRESLTTFLEWKMDDLKTLLNACLSSQHTDCMISKV